MTPDARTDELADRLARVRSRLAEACRCAGRDPADVELVVVTKFHPAADVARLAGLGVRRVGENRAQEAAAKRRDLLGDPACAELRWDMIGHLQSNKAAGVATWADRVQSVDSAKVIRELDKGRARARTGAEGTGGDPGPLPVLLQLSLDDDPGRGGARATELPALADAVAATEHLRLSGLMVVPPPDDRSAEHLRRAAEEARWLRRTHPGAVVFSAGMSGDLEDAVAAGSTCVRVGTAILGPRPIP